MKVEIADDGLAVVDEQLGASLAGDNLEIAKELLQILMTTLPEEAAEIEKHFHAKDWTTMANKVHKVHGATSYCGTPALKFAALTLERILKDHQTEEVPTAHELFQYEVQRLLDATQNG